MRFRRPNGLIQATIKHEGAPVAVIFVDTLIVPGEIVTFGDRQARAVRVDGTASGWSGTRQNVYVGVPWRAGP
jgi:hypothetical protein